MLLNGVLPPSASGKYIMENSSLVKINKDGVRKVAKQILCAVKDGSIEQVAFTAQKLHPKSADRDTFQRILLLDTINFSFWPDEGKKYDVSFEGESYTGYFAACAAVNKAIASGIPITDAKWMSFVGKEEVDRIFMSDSGHSIPLLEERVRVINEAGRVLIEKFDGEFYNCVKMANQSAQKLLELVVENFSSFRDFAEFNGQKVSLLKRAQILVSDIHSALAEHDPIANFHDIDSLTMFADYRVPQALAFLGALEYSTELLDRLGEGKRLENGSKEEVALRGASIAVCDDIVEEMNKLRKTDPEFENIRSVPASEVDVYVWVYRRQNAKEIERKVPFHRTRCIYY